MLLHAQQLDAGNGQKSKQGTVQNVGLLRNVDGNSRTPLISLSQLQIKPGHCLFPSTAHKSVTQIPVLPSSPYLTVTQLYGKQCDHHTKFVPFPYFAFRSQFCGVCTHKKAHKEQLLSTVKRFQLSGSPDKHPQKISIQL